MATIKSFIVRWFSDLIKNHPYLHHNYLFVSIERLMSSIIIQTMNVFEHPIIYNIWFHKSSNNGYDSYHQFVVWEPHCLSGGHNPGVGFLPYVDCFTDLSLPIVLFCTPRFRCIPKMEAFKETSCGSDTLMHDIFMVWPHGWSSLDEFHSHHAESTTEFAWPYVLFVFRAA